MNHTQPLPAEPSDFTKQALALLDVLWKPRIEDAIKRCAAAAAAAGCTPAQVEAVRNVAVVAK